MFLTEEERQFEPHTTALYHIKFQQRCFFWPPHWSVLETVSASASRLFNRFHITSTDDDIPFGSSDTAIPRC